MATPKKENGGDTDIFAELERLEGLKQQAIQQLLEERRGIDDKLAKLGYIEQQPTRSSGGGGERRSASEAVCPICTEALGREVKGHDKRAHRNHPAAFTEAELAAR